MTGEHAAHLQHNSAIEVSLAGSLRLVNLLDTNLLGVITLSAGKSNRLTLNRSVNFGDLG